ncbi:MAG: heme peroxidase [Actinobacteria bacterium]|nr:heme peroxidase [Actinomycetota bacterium]
MTTEGNRRHRVGLAAILCSSVFVAGGAVVTPSGLAAPADGTQFPWEGYDSPDAAAPVGAGFNLNTSDMRFILDQIKIAEQHAATATPQNPCGTLVGNGPNQIPNAVTGGELLPWGLRTVDGTCNNIVPGGDNWGAADELMPRLGPLDLRAAESFDPDGPGGAPATPTSYTQTSGIVADSEPRLISNLIVDQTAANPAAQAAAGANPVVDPITGTLLIENVAPDEGLSAPYNSIFTLFGQFFDHGLDLVGKGGSGTVFVPLLPDDPLYVTGSPTNFMVLTRATNQPGPDNQLGTSDDVHEHNNSTTPYVDQNQTYTSHPSHQVFLREYSLNGAGDPVSTGRLITVDGGMATWDSVQLQSEDLLGIALADRDVFNGPLLATDPYGKFIPGPNGYPQIVTTAGLVEGNPLANGGNGLTIPANAVRTGHAFLDDIAHHAAPGTWDHDGNPATPRIPQTPDTLAGTADDGLPGTYDDEMLGVHYVAGDGRANENIGLTAIHHVFHAEHNRLVPYMQNLITGLDPTQLPEWQLSPGVWNGERLFQAARFVTEMQYQHLVFEEFGRKVQPLINVFSGYEANVEVDISAEFAHAVYRFGHSMLNEEVLRYEPDGTPNHTTLFDAFLNPPSFVDGVGATVYTPDEAAGAVFRGMTTQVGNEIDEFVTDALRNRLVGLPLDLATLNIARARDTGIPTLNNARKAFYAATASTQLKPYESWFDFGLNMSTPESLVNYVAAYGTHPTITGSIAARREAAALLVAADPFNLATPADAQDFLFSTGAWANNGTTSITGLDDIDLWMGGLAEAKAPFGGMLGTTFNYVFETQMERLQNGDRFYYLTRTAGLNLLVQLEGNSFAELIMRNTDATNLPADVFSRPDYNFDLQFQNAAGPIVDDPNTPYNETILLVRMPDGTVRYSGGAHVSMHGTPNGDRMRTGDGDDTLRGNNGNDRMEGGIGVDNLIGGLGDDILTDTFGDDVLKGGDGDDYLGSGPGFDLNQGGLGNDFVVGGSDITETFAGPGNDIVFAGDDADTVFGDDGDDWQEGGGGADLMQGDNGAPFFNDLNTAGNDVIIGDGGNDDYDAEGGDDVMVAGPGVERYAGAFGFDWAIYKGDSQPAEADLNLDLAPLPPGVITNRDRFDATEGLSGHALNDTLRGSNDDALAMLGSELNAAGIARVNGLAALLPPLATSFTGGEIILGGLGSDIIEGRGGNDIIDGDLWFDVQLQAPNPATPDTNDVQLVNSLWALRAAVASGAIDPGDIQVVRSIKNSGSTGNDTAVFSGPFGDYDIAVVGSKLVVTHARGNGGAGGILDNGVDTLTNIEFLQFSDQTVPSPLGNGLLRVTSSPAVPTRITVDGIVRHDWGLDWLTVSAGSHEVCFSDVVGFTTPACQTVTVTINQTTVVEGVFAPLGLLQANVAPAGLATTIFVDGEERDEYGYYAFMEPGSHQVCWGDVPGYQAPACETVNVTANNTTTVTGTFTPSVSPTPGPAPSLGTTGFLRVTTNPAVPSRIVVDGVARSDWGLTWAKTPVGPREVCFTDVPGFITPACRIVVVNAGETTVTQGTYTPIGLIKVDVVPAGLPVDVIIDGTRRNQFGAYMYLEPGSYEVCGAQAIGYTTPNCQSVNVTGGAQTNVTLTYTLTP